MHWELLPLRRGGNSPTAAPAIHLRSLDHAASPLDAATTTTPRRSSFLTAPLTHRLSVSATMAYTHQPPGGGQPGLNGPPSASSNNGPDPTPHPQGTEYTLQGVMRFLQIEWHSHERARNAWTIERAEMKARIAKLEGENRQGKRINEQLVKQIMMLQKVVRAGREREKGVGMEGEEVDGVREGKEEKEKGNSFLQSGMAEEDANDKAREEYLDSTRKYLKDCMHEIQYLLTPPQHPPPQALPNGNYQTGLPDPPNLEDFYNERRRRNQAAIARESQLFDQKNSSAPDRLPQNALSQDVNRDGQKNHNWADLRGQRPPPESLEQNPERTGPTYDDYAVENVTHTFDSRGRAVPTPPDAGRQAKQQPEADGWTFDEEHLPPDHPPPDIPNKRPDTDLFPNAASNTHLSAKSPPRTGSISHRRKSSGSQAMSRRRSSQGKTDAHEAAEAAAAADPSQFKVKFALRGHLDVVRSVIFSGGGSPSEPEVCTAGDDGTIKRWIIPGQPYQNFTAGNNTPDLDVTAYFTHRGHEGVVTSLATCPASTGFSTGGRAPGDGWIFSGGQDATIRVWERGRVDPKATLEGHTDAVWSVCVLPASIGVVFGPESSNYGGPDRLLLVSGSADGTVKVWAVSSPPTASSPSSGSRRGDRGSRRHSVTSGSNFPSSPQPSVASAVPCSYTLVHSIPKPNATRDTKGAPTCICPLSPSGETFVVSYTDSSVFIFDTRTGEMLSEMQSSETYDGTMNTSINTVVATGMGLEGAGQGGGDASRGVVEAEEVGAGATGSREGVEGVVISGHEDRYVRFFDANSGMFLYSPSSFFANVTHANPPIFSHRPSHVHHARPPLGHLLSLPQQRRPRGRLRRPRREYPLLVPREADLYAGYRLPSCDERRGRVLCCVESGWKVGRQCGRGWGRQGLCAMMIVMGVRRMLCMFSFGAFKV